MKMFSALAAGLAAMLAVAGCSTFGASQKGDIAALEVALAAAETGAASYAGLPACGSPNATAACSDTAIVAQMKAKDALAYKTLKDAETVAASGGSPSLTAATAAITALQTLIPATPRTGP